MRKYVLIFALISTAGAAFSQTYISFAPSLTNSAGTLAGKSNLAFELGRQWDVFSLGIDFGKTTLDKMVGRDTTTYLELRPNLNIFQQGKFTNTFTAGIGYIFHAKDDLMTELTSGIEYAYSDRLHFNIVFGQYFYSGREDATTVTFFGLSLMYYFSHSQHTSLFSRKDQK